MTEAPLHILAQGRIQPSAGTAKDAFHAVGRGNHRTVRRCGETLDSGCRFAGGIMRAGFHDPAGNAFRLPLVFVSRGVHAQLGLPRLGKHPVAAALMICPG